RKFVLQVVEANRGAFEVVAFDLDGEPATVERLSYLSGDVASRERVDDEVAGIGEHFNEEPRDVRREASRVRLPPRGLACIEIFLVVPGVRNAEQVRRNRAAAVTCKAFAHDVP